jgi:hypothetical protein
MAAVSYCTTAARSLTLHSIVHPADMPVVSSSWEPSLKLYAPMMQTTSSLDRMLDNVMLSNMSSGELAIGSSPHGCGGALC